MSKVLKDALGIGGMTCIDLALALLALEEQVLLGQFRFVAGGRGRNLRGEQVDATQKLPCQVLRLLVPLPFGRESSLRYAATSAVRRAVSSL